jgi:hypothetical protein
MASRIEASVALLVELCRDAERVVPWLLGAQLPRAAVCWHYVSELALHGRDIANGARLRWEIDPYHARMAIEGFYVPMIGALDAASAGDDDPDWPSCEVRLRGGGRFSFAGTGSGVTLRPPDHRVDLHISADPVAMLLVMSGRSGRLLPALRGRMVAWGKHPVRAMRLLARMEAP